MQLWGADPNAAQLITAGTQRVYRVNHGDRCFYLRVTPEHVRTRTALGAEVDFVEYLGERGLTVAAPVASRSGAFVEAIDVGATGVQVTAFEEAPGDAFHYDPSADNRAHFRLRGGMLGRMHALSRHFVRSRPASANRLSRWDDDRLLRDASQYVPASDGVFWSEFRDLRAWLDALPTDPASFGPIHGDFGTSNYRVTGDTLTLFDFGDACRHWYAYDVAVSLYPYGERPERHTLLEATLEGYSAESPVAADWMGALGWFCRLRVVYMYLVYADRWGLSSRAADHAAWFARKRDRMRHPVEWGRRGDT